MQDHCPLIDNRGRPLKLSSIRYSHLAQLHIEQIEEGYTVEYKSQWDRKFIDGKLCQTMASFANSSGGWLFVGVTDEKEVCNITKEKHDFSQQIGNILSAHVSPIPVFECRFIRKTAQQTTGVLVIHVFEGVNPPYVSKGTIYIRNGSNKTPINANRTDIDNLFSKSRRFRRSLDDLLSRPIDSTVGKNPCCVIALSNINCSSYQLSTSEVDIIDNKVKDSGSFSATIRTAESILFLNSDLIGPNSVTSYVELFFNTSIRIVIYFPCLSKLDRDNIKEYILAHNANINIADFVLVDFCIATVFINMILNSALKVIKCARQELSRYSIQIEFRNTRDTILYFGPIEDFIEKISKNGLKYAIRDTQRTFIEEISTSKTKYEENIFIGKVYKYFSQAFGYHPKQLIDLYGKLIDDHEEYFNLDKNTFKFDYDRI